MSDAVLIFFLFAACVSDLGNRCIPNMLVVLGVSAGMLLSLAPGGVGPAASVGGLLTGLLITFPLYAIGGIGAGDSKLAAMIGVFLGPVAMLDALVYGGMAGTFLVLVVVVSRRIPLPILHRTRSLALSLVTGGRAGERMTLADADAITVPMGVAISVGAAAAILFPILGAG